MKKLINMLSIFVVALFSGACVVHHHHHHGGEREGSSEGHGDYSTQYEPREELEPAQEVPEPAVETTDSASPPVEGEGDLFGGCQVRSYASGWIDATCGAMQIFVLTGPAAQRNDALLLELAAEHTSRTIGDGTRPRWDWSDAGTVRMRAGTFELRSAVFENRRDQGAMGFAPAEEREIYAEALALVAPTSHGRAAMICSEEGGLDEERCLEIFDDLTHEPLGQLGASSEDIVSIAGVPMRFSERCYYNQPEVLVCLASSSVTWVSGTRAEAQRALDRELSVYSGDRGIAGYHNPQRQYDCRIGGNRANCHEVDVQGVLDSPHQIVYLALVEAPEEFYSIECTVNVEEEMSEPCRLLFGGQTTGRYH